jgi:hypothetical protein
VKATGTRCGGSFWQIVPVGDINGDGVNDFASAVPYSYIPGLPEPGYVVIFSGNRNWVTSVTPPSVPPFASSHSLAQNYPNPFNPSTTITYTLSRTAHLRIQILDQLGRAIATLINHEEGNGTHTVSWNGRDDEGRTVGTGIYYYQLEVDSRPIETRKLILLK